MELIYIEYTFKVSPLQPASDIIIAQLGELGFESFVENEDGVQAYIQKPDWNEGMIDDIQILNSGLFEISYEQKEIPQENWNIDWEKNFEAIVVDDKCTVRAPFHEIPTTEFDIIIEPKMSFGTGHHETTHMMLQFLMKEDLARKKVLDMGCGTAVLAIMAEKRGAKPIDAIDIDNWCYLNSLENVERNNCKEITVMEGESSLLAGKKYDVIIANINRNILLNDIEVYAKALNSNGVLLLSGFYKEDINVLNDRCKQFTLNFVENIEKNNWVAVKYIN